MSFIFSYPLIFGTTDTLALFYPPHLLVLDLGVLWGSLTKLGLLLQFRLGSLYLLRFPSLRRPAFWTVPEGHEHFYFPSSTSPGLETLTRPIFPNTVSVTYHMGTLSPFEIPPFSGLDFWDFLISGHSPGGLPDSFAFKVFLQFLSFFLEDFAHFPFMWCLLVKHVLVFFHWSPKQLAWIDLSSLPMFLL